MGCLSSEEHQGRKVHHSGVQSGLEFLLPLYWWDLEVPLYISVLYINAWIVQKLGLGHMVTGDYIYVYVVCVLYVSVM